MQTTSSTEIRSVPLAALQLSQTTSQIERRKYLDKGKLTELAESIKSHGLVQPILVRPCPFREVDEELFEVVAGERRVLAAREAGLEQIQATVRDLNDEQVLELQLIENLQRQDLHELAEAEGYEALAKLGHTVDDMAIKVGKSRATIYARMKLLSLESACRKAFYSGKISASVALLLARLHDPKAQLEALETVTGARFADEPMSYRDAHEYIQREYMFRLDQAGFSTIDPDLVPEAGSCVACPKRTGNQRELFGDIKRTDVCTDASCYQLKRQATSARKLAEAEASGQQIIKGKDAKAIAKYGTHSLQAGYVRLDDHCYDDGKHRTYRQLLGKSATPALLVAPESGDVIEVLDKSSVRDALKERGVKVYSTTSPSYSGTQRAEDKKRKRERKFRRALFDAIHAKAPDRLRRADLEIIALSLFNRQQHETQKQFCAALGWEPKKAKHHNGVTFDGVVDAKIPQMSDAELAQFLTDCAIAEELIVWSYSKDKPARMYEAAAALGIDPEKLRKQLVDEEKEKSKPTPKAAKKKGRAKR